MIKLVGNRKKQQRREENPKEQQCKFGFMWDGVDGNNDKGTWKNNNW